jgi:protease I
MPSIRDARILIMATDGFEQSELTVPLEKLRAAGAHLQIAAPKGPTIKGWAETDWGESVTVDLTIKEASAENFDALVLPGGQMNPDKLRMDDDAIDLILDFIDEGKPVAAICHAPWLLIEADAVEGRRMTSWLSIKTDVENAGGEWVDEEVVVDDGIITSRSPKDLDAFVARIISEVEATGGGDELRHSA